MQNQRSLKYPAALGQRSTKRRVAERPALMGGKLRLSAGRRRASGAVCGMGGNGGALAGSGGRVLARFQHARYRRAGGWRTRGADARQAAALGGGGPAAGWGGLIGGGVLAGSDGGVAACARAPPVRRL